MRLIKNLLGIILLSPLVVSTGCTASTNDTGHFGPGPERDKIRKNLSKNLPPEQQPKENSPKPK